MRKPAAEAIGWLVAIIPFIARTTERVPPPRGLGRSPTAFCEFVGSADELRRMVSMRMVAFLIDIMGPQSGANRFPRSPDHGRSSDFIAQCFSQCQEASIAYHNQ